VWKYKKHEVRYMGAYASEDYHQLDKLGRQGWEAYFIDLVVQGSYREVYYLKKEFPPNKALKPKSKDSA